MCLSVSAYLCDAVPTLPSFSHLLDAHTVPCRIASFPAPQLLSHLDLEIVFSRLPNLAGLSLTYGVRKIGMKYDRSLFGMKISDAMSLAKCVRATETLTTLVLPCNMIDDDLLRMLMTGLIRNQVRAPAFRCVDERVECCLPLRYYGCQLIAL